MYFTKLPDHTTPGFDEDAHFSKFQQHNIVFNAAYSSSACDEHIGCLSIKTIVSGTEWYGIDHRQLAVQPGQYLVLNNDQHYSCRIPTSEKAHIFSIFFSKEFASAVYDDAMKTETKILDHPSFHNSIIPEFYQTLNPVSSALNNRMHQLMLALQTNDEDEALLEEHLVFMLRHLLFTHKSELKRQASIDAIKTSTRHEIHKRLFIARDLMNANFCEPLDLNMISACSLLSVPQLIRQFRAVFHCTPHQYLIRLRLEHAAALLRNTNQTIQDISWACGFQNNSAFCRAFKSAFGMQPLNYRTACQ